MGTCDQRETVHAFSAAGPSHRWPAFFNSSFSKAACSSATALCSANSNQAAPGPYPAAIRRSFVTSSKNNIPFPLAGLQCTQDQRILSRSTRKEGPYQLYRTSSATLRQQSEPKDARQGEDREETAALTVGSDAAAAVPN